MTQDGLGVQVQRPSAGNLGRAMGQMRSSGEFPLAEGRSDIVLFRSSSNWMKPTHVVEGSLLYL